MITTYSRLIFTTRSLLKFPLNSIVFLEQRDGLYLNGILAEPSI
jgi:hypothetical protein